MPHHGLEIKLVDASLGEEYGIIVDHHEHMVKWLVWSLILPVVKGDTSAWAYSFDKKGIFISIFSVDQELESVEEENDASKSQVGWQQVSDSIVVTSVHVEAWIAPDNEDGKLQEHNVTIVSLVEGDFP